jgi:hypothetical protein
MNEVDLPEEIYDVTASGHLRRAVMLRNRLMKVNPMQFALYAALELRNAIERLLFEYLVIIHGGENVSKKMEKEYRAYSLRKRIENVEPEFQKKIEYMDLMLRAVGMTVAVVPDVDALSTLYSRLNDYLHAWKRPEETAQKRVWWSGLWQTLDETERLLTQILSGTIGHVKLNEKGWQTYEAWKNNKLSDEDVIESFRQDLRGQ